MDVGLHRSHEHRGSDPLAGHVANAHCHPAPIEPHHVEEVAGDEAPRQHPHRVGEAVHGAPLGRHDQPLGIARRGQLRDDLVLPLLELRPLEVRQRKPAHPPQHLAEARGVGLHRRFLPAVVQVQVRAHRRPDEDRGADRLGDPQVAEARAHRDRRVGGEAGQLARGGHSDEGSAEREIRFLPVASEVAEHLDLVAARRLADEAGAVEAGAVQRRPQQRVGERLLVGGAVHRGGAVDEHAEAVVREPQLGRAHVLHPLRQGPVFGDDGLGARHLAHDDSEGPRLDDEQIALGHRRRLAGREGNRVEGHAVSALEVGDEPSLAALGNRAMTPRHFRVGQADVAIGIPPEDRPRGGGDRRTFHRRPGNRLEAERFEYRFGGHRRDPGVLPRFFAAIFATLRSGCNGMVWGKVCSTWSVWCLSRQRVGAGRR